MKSAPAHNKRVASTQGCITRINRKPILKYFERKALEGKPGPLARRTRTAAGTRNTASKFAAYATTVPRKKVNDVVQNYDIASAQDFIDWQNQVFDHRMQTISNEGEREIASQLARILLSQKQNANSSEDLRSYDTNKKAGSRESLRNTIYMNNNKMNDSKLKMSRISLENLQKDTEAKRRPPAKSSAPASPKSALVTHGRTEEEVHSSTAQAQAEQSKSDCSKIDLYIVNSFDRERNQHQNAQNLPLQPHTRNNNLLRPHTEQDQPYINISDAQ